MVNKVHKMLQGNNTFCFIIQTENESDFWWWEVSKNDFCNFWLKRDLSKPIANIELANEFVNSDECSHCGCSCASFETVEDAIKDYMA